MIKPPTTRGPTQAQAQAQQARTAAPPLSDGLDMAGLEPLARLAGSWKRAPASELSPRGRELLDHAGSMTERLEAFHGGRAALETLESRTRGGWHERSVLLRLGPGGRPVEFGAIRVCLATLPEPLRRDVLGESVPLGRALREHRFAARIEPLAFLLVEPGPELARLFGLPEGSAPPLLEGRRARMREAEGPRRLVADIFEVLPPAP